MPAHITASVTAESISNFKHTPQSVQLNVLRYSQVTLSILFHHIFPTDKKRDNNTRLCDATKPHRTDNIKILIEKSCWGLYVLSVLVNAVFFWRIVDIKKIVYVNFRNVVFSYNTLSYYGEILE